MAEKLARWSGKNPIGKPRQLSEALEQAIRSRIREHTEDHSHEAVYVAALNWVLEEAGLKPEKAEGRDAE